MNISGRTHLASWFAFLIPMTLVACSWFRPHGVQVVLTNQSGTAITNLEFDFPGGSFGISSIPPGGSVTRWFNPNTTGDLRLIFEDPAGKHEQKLANAVTKLSGRLAVQLLEKSRATASEMKAP